MMMLKVIQRPSELILSPQSRGPELVPSAFTGPGCLRSLPSQTSHEQDPFRQQQGQSCGDDAATSLVPRGGAQSQRGLFSRLKSQ